MMKKALVIMTLLMAVAATVFAAPKKRTTAFDFVIWAANSADGCDASQEDYVRFVDELFAEAHEKNYTNEKEVLAQIYLNKDGSTNTAVIETTYEDGKGFRMIISRLWKQGDDGWSTRVFFNDLEALGFVVESTLDLEKPVVVYESETKYITHK